MGGVVVEVEAENGVTGVGECDVSRFQGGGGAL